MSQTPLATEMLEQLVVPTFVLDASGRVIVWNRACEELTGMPADRVMGSRDHWQAFYPECRPCLADLVLQERLDEIPQFYPDFDQMVCTGQVAHAENWCQMPLLNTERYLAIDAGPVRDAAGRIIAVVETLRDRTSHKLAEIRLRQMASVFEHSQEGILITDPKTRILDVNASFVRVTGYSREEVLGRTPALLKSGVQDADFYRRLWRDLNETGRWHGEIWNRKKSGELYPEILHINAVCDPSGQVTHYIGMFIDITDLKNTQQRLEHLAHYDLLTGLPNRLLLVNRLRQAWDHAQQYERLIAVCFLDLDNFKLVNDHHGHEIGDRLLIEIGRRLLDTLRSKDTVSRLGGDEFVILLNDLRNQEELDTVLVRLLDRVAHPVCIDDLQIAITVSIGVTLYPLDDHDPDTLLRHADQAMYQAKQMGRNRYQLFDPKAAKAMQSRHRELERLRQALQHGEFRLYYQPKVNMRLGQVIGMEALIRWQHPERGLIPPLQFLPLIEDSPLTIDLGEWVLHEALEQIQQWCASGRPLVISVNIAAHHFQQPDFVPRLQSILAEHPKAPPRLLELEILESAALEDIRSMRGIMTACQAMGVRFALDDFGTGYSSLSYLKQLPAETLKIDQSFVRDMLEDPEDLAIIEGVIGLARVFRKEVIAEGVETPEQGLLLMRFGCDRAQGYGIGRPMPAEQVSDWMDGFAENWQWNLWMDPQLRSLDIPLLLIQYDHIKWIRHIVQAVESGERLPPAEAPTASVVLRFDTWYSGEGRTQYGQLPAYTELGGLHHEILRLGRLIIERHGRGETAGLSAECDALIALKKRLLHQLKLLHQRRADPAARAT
ncbi:EAL domain-containing protein [Thermochromatium tepidum]|uniref:EAL domain-containing protein n=1 Tax=Thermochromatium tepidum ATCC 43061 TaxID=316276 RepID=A0A6I6E1T3_THETI|nr:EAL domain-containing protein [Thermochromatium tepidum]QGU33854.1 EAL domain-containing protein [Thermochromatium tepidum ATCC 43061]